MRITGRVVAVVAVTVVVVAGTTVYAVDAYRDSRAPASSASEVLPADLDAVTDVPHVVFRSTAPGPEYGLVAMSPLTDPAGPRAFTTIACDRIDAVNGAASCLRTVRGIATRFEAELLDESWESVRTWPLPGVPSRTRLSDDGSLVATTSFVTGHSYGTVGFSTATEVHSADGTSSGNIEQFAFTVDGKPFVAADRNFWGVTFVDADTFYATAASASAGTTWLVRGSLSARTLESVREGVECPSLSPDRARVAFKKDVGSGGTVHWSVAVLDLESGTETVLGETRSVDDQMEWLDDSTVLYGLPREGQAGATDIWSLAVAEGAVAEIFVPDAWSPAVVRP